jgi:hypothetical protein
VGRTVVERSIGRFQPFEQMTGTVRKVLAIWARKALWMDVAHSYGIPLIPELIGLAEGMKNPFLSI